MRQSIANGFRQASCSTSRAFTHLPSRCSVASTSYAKPRSLERSLPGFVAPSLRFSTSQIHSDAEHWRGEQASERANNTSDSLPPSMVKSPSGRRRSNASVTGQGNKAHAKSPVKQSDFLSANSKSINKPTNDRDHWLGRSTAPTPRARVDLATSKNEPSKDEKVTSVATESATADPASPAPPKKTIAERIRGLWANVKYLFRFYYNGVKQIWSDRQTVRDMRAQIAQRKLDGKGDIRWLEKAVIELHQSDVRKLPLFLAILIILEEILPLVVIYAPSLLPSTCILPSQSLKMRAEEERKRGLAIKRLAGHEDVRAAVDRLADNVCLSEQAHGKISDVSKNTARLSNFEPSVIRDFASVFGLRTWGPISMVNARIDKHLRFLRDDDPLLIATHQIRTPANEDWSKVRQSDWLWRASGKRGLRVSEVDQSAMERNLTSYLQLSEKANTDISPDDLDEAAVLFRRALVPLAIYDGTSGQLRRLETDANEEASKGIRKRTKEVVESVVEEEKRKEEAKKV